MKIVRAFLVGFVLLASIVMIAGCDDDRDGAAEWRREQYEDGLRHNLNESSKFNSQFGGGPREQPNYVDPGSPY